MSFDCNCEDAGMPTTEREWLEGRLHNDCVPYIPVREKLGKQRPAPYSMSQACHEIDELRVVCSRWADDYQLLAEQADEIRESRERLRIRVCELEGQIEMQFTELREAHRQLSEAHAAAGRPVHSFPRRDS